MIGMARLPGVAADEALAMKGGKASENTPGLSSPSDPHPRSQLPVTPPTPALKSQPPCVTTKGLFI